jgi:hypothetical protein
MGYNYFGQLGQGRWDAAAHPQPVRVAQDVAGVQADAQGLRFGRTDGTSWITGCKIPGQAGNEGWIRHATPVPQGTGVAMAAAT